LFVGATPCSLGLQKQAFVSKTVSKDFWTTSPTRSSMSGRVTRSHAPTPAAAAAPPAQPRAAGTRSRGAGRRDSNSGRARASSVPAAAPTAPASSAATPTLPIRPD
ncbi:unnamed protein product, partial [Pylaiella littoralis]